ncbi:autotransporter family protein [Hyphomicrobium sp.]|uniref:autotransporter family protein n=1 Tax=Hyphomicrobium sp. TaxID=82 RepID=UPI003F6E909D
MTRSKFRARRFTTAAATFSLTVALSLSVSHTAMAACSFSPGPAATAGNDVVECNDANGTALNLLAGDDKLTVNDGAVLTGGTATGGIGNDLMIINGGVINVNMNPGTGNNSLGDTDRIFVFGGTFNNIEIQGGSGQNNFTYLMGGTVETGGIEINRGSVNHTLVFDGATTNGAEVFEFQNGNAGTPNATRDPVFYFRSGSITAEEMEFGATDFGGAANTHVTVIFDPIHAMNAADRVAFQAFVNSASANDAALSTTNLNAALAGAPANTDGRKMVVNVKEIEFGAGNDTLIFEGAINTGDQSARNLELNGEEDEPGEFEITELSGGAGVDRLIVRGASRLALGEVEDFEHLAVTGASKLTLGEGEYEFEDSVTVDGTSELHLSGTEVSFTTEHFELQGGAGLEALAGLPSYYNAFATGGVLRIGALPGAAGGDDDDALMALDDDDDDDDGPSAAPVSVTFNVGGNTFVNNGTITMLNGVVGDNLTVVGPYTSTGGNLALDTELGGAGSPTDLLSIQGTVAGTTTIYVNNVGGAGAATGPDGIVIAASDSGAFAADSFRLAANALSGREEVVAGAFSYRLAVSGDDARLQSDLLDQVPAYTTAPSVGQRLVSGGLDTLYKRLGEIRGGHNDGATSGDGLVWVRGHYSDVDVDAKQGFDFSQRSSGVLVGAGGVIAGEGRSRLAVGAFGGYGTADAGVDATIFGAASSSSVDAESYSFGGYATFYEQGRAGTGLYADAVVKVDFLDFDMAANNRAARGSSDGDAFSGSAEVGYGFAIGNGLVLQPQGQLAYTNLTVNNFTDAAYALAVSYGSSESLVGRLGLQIQGNWAQPGGGYISPYAIVNVYQDFEGTSTSEINGTDFTSDIGGTWYSVGGGVNAQLANNVSLYGSGEYHFGDVEGWQGTGGVKLNW